MAGIHGNDTFNGNCPAGKWRVILAALDTGNRDGICPAIRSRDDG